MLFSGGPGLGSSKNKPLRRRESEPPWGISKERRTRPVNHFAFASFSGLQLKEKGISQWSCKAGIVEMLPTESMTLTPRDIFFMIL